MPQTRYWQCSPGPTLGWPRPGVSVVPEIPPPPGQDPAERNLSFCFVFTAASLDNQTLRAEGPTTPASLCVPSMGVCPVLT